MRPIRRAAGAAVFGLLATAAGLQAQGVPGIGLGAAWETYDFRTPATIDIESLSVLSVPLGGTLQLSRQVVLGVGTSWARATMVRADGSEVTLSGLTDTELSAQLELGRGAARITALALLPTGKSSLTPGEMLIVGAVAADVLPLRVTDWGTGGGAGLNVAVAQPIGGFAVGVSAGYVVARSYEPLDNAFDYRPGNQLHLRAAIDRTIGTSAKAAVRVDWRRFGADEGNGRNLFQTGDRFQVVGTLDFALRSSSAILYTGWLTRGEGEFIDTPDLLPAQDLLFAGAGLRSGIGAATLQPSLNVRILDSNGADRKGYTLDAGASLEIPAGRSLLIPTVRGRLGRIEASSGDDSGFTGLELGLAVRFGGGL